MMERYGWFFRMATVGTSSMSVAELVQNITTSTNQIAAALPGGAENISRVYIKTEDSMAIPIYTSLGGSTVLSLAKPFGWVVSSKMFFVWLEVAKCFGYV